VSYLLAFVGFSALIILHEAGHFVAAKAVGMRVERFSLFFGPMLVKFRRGETEYGVGPIPLGGYVKITGMNPYEEIPEEVEDRAYYRQPVWKRVVVILAGPAVNIVLAFVILWVLILSHGQTVPVNRVAAGPISPPASTVLRPGDEIVSVDGVRGSPDAIRNAIGKHHCPGAQTNGCLAATPAHIVVRRNGQLLSFDVRPRYDAASDVKRPLLGFTFVQVTKHVGPGAAASLSVTDLWGVTTQTVSAVVRIFEPKVRSQLHGAVGVYKVTQQDFAHDTTTAFEILALISLSLGIINLFPFLPLDGGHVFWALAEKVRGKRIPFSVMERASAVGFVLIVLLFVVGLSNDISTLAGKGFAAH
jgi:regulator of sigma E protease